MGWKQGGPEEQRGEGVLFGGPLPGPLLGGANERLTPHSRPP